ncbi:MAG TPA: hypothetical protein VGC07_04470 [Granulicella sp.]
MSTSKNIAESFRDVVQDLLVPELKSLKVSIDSLRTEMTLRDEKQAQAIQFLSEKLDFALDIRERLATLEARLPRQ